MNNKVSHRDCRQFAPVDVAQGICHVYKSIVPADSEGCPKFVRMPKCKHCRNFETNAARAELGNCAASPHQPKFVAYPDMVAITCGNYEE